MVYNMLLVEQVCTAIDNKLFCYLVVTDYNGKVIYSDLAGRFQIKSHKGINYYVNPPVYEYSYIIVQTIKSRKDTDMVAVFKEMYQELQAKGHQPRPKYTYWTTNDPELSKTTSLQKNKQKSSLSNLATIASTPQNQQ